MKYNFRNCLILDSKCSHLLEYERLIIFRNLPRILLSFKSNSLVNYGEMIGKCFFLIKISTIIITKSRREYKIK